MDSPRRVLRSLLWLVAILLCLPASAASAADREVKIGASIFLATSTQTEEDVARCSYAVFVQIPSYAGATSYNVVVKDKHPRVNATRNFTGPPFNDEAEGFKTGGGTHWFGALTSGSGPAPCPTDADFGPRFEIVRAVAIFDDSSRIVGTVRNPDGSGVAGVRVSASGRQRASATTNAGGGYSMKVKKGSYEVSARGHCVVGSARCRSSKNVSVGSGPEVVDFRPDSAFSVSGVVRDEFGRGIAGVRTGLTGPENTSDTTDASGRYRLKVAQTGTYELTAAGSGRGPNERYYIMQGGQPSEGTAADVTLTEQTTSVELDWELDRRLQFSVLTHAPPRANGVSRTTLVVRALTQHGDPAPGVELDVDPPTGAVPHALMCSTSAPQRPLWPSINSDGSVSPVGIPVGPDTTTDAKGEVAFGLFPGTQPGAFAISGGRRTGDGRAFSTFSQAIEFTAPPPGNFNEGTLRKGLQQAGPGGTTFFGSQAVVLDLLAAAQRAPDTNLLYGVDAVPVSTGNKRGIAFFAIGRPPAENADGSLAASDEAFVLEDSVLARVTAMGGLPSLRTWTEGHIQIERSDRRTYLGWPLPTTSNGGAGSCLEGSSDTLVFAAHSPVRILLTDSKGKRVGTDARGKRYADAPGGSFRVGESTYVVVPKGSYTLGVAGTGSGPVTLETRNGGVTSTARFRARKGARVALAVPGGVLPRRFTFAGQRVRSTAGIPLVVKGLPKRLKVGAKKRVRLRVTDAFGAPVPGAALTTSGPVGARVRFADAGGRLGFTLRAARKGRARFTVTAPSLVPFARSVKAAR